MKYSWFSSVFPIAAIFSFRMLGLFMLIPVFTLFASELRDATPTLIGVALGSYGLSQGLLQMPFGILSDWLGRKTILTIGLTLFAFGSLLGAFSHSIYTMILARILQGMGAVGSVLIALMADLTPEEQRTKAMALIGLAIGFSFMVAMILSPFITAYYGLAGIFYFTAALAGIGLFLLHKVIPSPSPEPFALSKKNLLQLIKPVLKDSHLQGLNLGIFFQHLILTATFYPLPLILKDHQVLGHLSQTWHFYLFILLFSFIFMLPFIMLSEKKIDERLLFFFAISGIILCQGFLANYYESWTSLCLVLLVYFMCFNFLEASLPAMISKKVNSSSKGTAMGIYSTSQFLGIFVGGCVAGIMYGKGGYKAIFMLNMLLAIIWLMSSYKLLNFAKNYPSLHRK